MHLDGLERVVQRRGGHRDIAKHPLAHNDDLVC